MQEVLDIRQARATQGGETEQAQARTYWEGRKGELGITDAQPMAHKLYAITEARAQLRDHPPERPVVDLDKRWDTPLIGNRDLADLSYARPEKLWGRRPKESGALSDRTGGTAGRLSAGGE